MSLLDGGAGFESVTVYPEESYTDADGNTMTRASSTGISTTARWQYEGQSGTSSRDAETQSEGFETESVYIIRFPRSFIQQYGTLGAQAKVKRDSDGKVYSIFGDAKIFNSSRRTAHQIYNVWRK